MSGNRCRRCVLPDGSRPLLKGHTCPNKGGPIRDKRARSPSPDPQYVQEKEIRELMKQGVDVGSDSDKVDPRAACDKMKDTMSNALFTFLDEFTSEAKSTKTMMQGSIDALRAINGKVNDEVTKLRDEKETLQRALNDRQNELDKVKQFCGQLKKAGSHGVSPKVTDSDRVRRIYCAVIDFALDKYQTCALDLQSSHGIGTAPNGPQSLSATYGKFYINLGANGIDNWTEMTMHDYQDGLYVPQKLYDLINGTASEVNYQLAINGQIHDYRAYMDSSLTIWQQNKGYATERNIRHDPPQPTPPASSSTGPSSSSSATVGRTPSPPPGMPKPRWSADLMLDYAPINLDDLLLLVKNDYDQLIGKCFGKAQSISGQAVSEKLAELGTFWASLSSDVSYDQDATMLWFRPQHLMQWLQWAQTEHSVTGNPLYTHARLAAHGCNPDSYASILSHPTGFDWHNYANTQNYGFGLYLSLTTHAAAHYTQHKGSRTAPANGQMILGLLLTNGSISTYSGGNSTEPYYSYSFMLSPPHDLRSTWPDRSSFYNAVVVRETSLFLPLGVIVPE